MSSDNFNGPLPNQSVTTAFQSQSPQSQYGSFYGTLNQGTSPYRGVSTASASAAHATKSVPPPGILGSPLSTGSPDSPVVIPGTSSYGQSESLRLGSSTFQVPAASAYASASASASVNQLPLPDANTPRMQVDGEISGLSDSGLSDSGLSDKVNTADVVDPFIMGMYPRTIARDEDILKYVPYGDWVSLDEKIKPAYRMSLFKDIQGLKDWVAWESFCLTVKALCKTVGCGNIYIITNLLEIFDGDFEQTHLHSKDPRSLQEAFQSMTFITSTPNFVDVDLYKFLSMDLVSKYFENSSVTRPLFPSLSDMFNKDDRMSSFTVKNMSLPLGSRSLYIKLKWV